METSPTAPDPAPRRKLRLRYPAKCSVCGCDLKRGTEAWWEVSTKTVTCLVCGGGAELARELASTAGASGREKYERLHERQAVSREVHIVLGQDQRLVKDEQAEAQPEIGKDP